jgi:hypothetical protein
MERRMIRCRPPEKFKKQGAQAVKGTVVGSPTF